MVKDHCVVITAYKSIDMLRSLLNVLDKRMICYVHIDRRCWNRFKGIQSEFQDVTFLSEYNVTWGGIEHLEAILKMLELSLTHEYKYVHIISGEDFPIKKIEDMERFFENTEMIYADYEFIDGRKNHADRRYRFYWPYVKFSMDYKNNGLGGSICFLFQSSWCFPFLNKKKLGDIEEVYWGFVWGSYPRKAIQYVLKYIKEHQEFWNDLMTCKIPEELCFQTILMNSDLKKLMVNDNLRFWKFEGGNGSGPVYLKMEDYSEIEQSNAFFARKILYDSEIRKRLEKKIT